MNFLYSSYLMNTIWFTAFGVVATVLALTDVEKDCIAKNNSTTMSNDFLFGTWYKIYKFIHLGPYPTCSCLNVTFSRPTEEELKGYRDKYGSVNLPHEIDDDAVLEDINYMKGLLLGGSVTKTYIIDPESVMVNNLNGYEVNVYRRVNDKYMIYWQCALRGHVKWLLTRDPNAPEVELQKIIRDRPEIMYKDSGVRFCNGTCYYK